MVKHISGAIYQVTNLKDFFLGVYDLKGYKQLIGTPRYNLKRDILAFHTNEPRIWDAYNPLTDDHNPVIQTGIINLPLIRVIDSDYHFEDLGMIVVKALLDEKEIDVILPLNFEKNFTFKPLTYRQVRITA